MKFINLLIFLLIISSCQSNGLFDGGDPAIKEIQLTTKFDRIETSSIFDITLVNDTISKVVVSCGENLLKLVTIEEKNGIVYIKHTIKYNWSRKYEKIKLEIHCNQDFSLYAYEPVHLITKGTFKANSFFFVDWGKFCELDVSVESNYCGIYMGADSFGGYTVKGKTVSCEIWAGGSSIIRADSLISEDCYVRQRGWGDVYINVRDRLTVLFECSSNIYYHGNPLHIETDQKVATGKIISMDTP